MFLKATEREIRYNAHHRFLIQYGSFGLSVISEKRLAWSSLPTRRLIN